MGFGCYMAHQVPDGTVVLLVSGGGAVIRYKMHLWSSLVVFWLLGLAIGLVV